MRRAGKIVSAVLVLVGSAGAQTDAPSHPRPYFMPRRERERIRGLIARHDWARAEYERVQAAAGKGNGYEAAFLYALDGEAKHVPAARRWLLKKYGPKAWAVRTYGQRMADPNHFKAAIRCRR